LAKDVCQGWNDLSLLAKGLCQLSEGLFSLTKALLLLDEARSFLSKRVSPTSKRLSFVSKPLRLESERLFVESERLLRERTARSMTNLVAPIYLSVKGTISSDGRRPARRLALVEDRRLACCAPR